MVNKKIKEYYFINNDVDPDDIFGEESVCCLDKKEVMRLSEEWGTNLFNDMHIATVEEIQLYGVYDS